MDKKEENIHTILLPSKRFKIQIKIVKINRPVPKFYID